MARKARIYGPRGCTYSVHSRTNDSEVLRFQRKDVALLFFQVVAEAKERFKFALNMQVLMGAHYHLKFVPRNNDLSKIMHWINSVFAMRYNKLTGHTGRLWRERFKSCVLNDYSYYINTAVYLALNPARAGIASAEEYPFSSLIFLYKNKHPLQEFEAYRHIFDEPYDGYFKTVKELVRLKTLDERLIDKISMAPRPIGRPRKQTLR